MTDENEYRFLAEEAQEVGRATPLPPVDRVDVRVGDGVVSALRWGAGAPQLTLLHGAALNAHTWDSTLLALDRPAIAIDLPGHGRSSWRDDFDYGPVRTAEAVAAVLDDQAPGSPQVVVGQSLGGLTAIALAEHRPDLVSAVVVVDASPGLRVGDARQVSDFLAGPNVFPDRDTIVDRAIAAGIGTDRHRIARGVELNTRVRDDGNVVWSHHLASPPAELGPVPVLDAGWEGLTESDVPVLLVRARGGFLRPEAVTEFRERVPRAVVVETDTGHNVQEQEPAELARLIAAFAAG
ncbi:alpha/beta fold hydrolase [uncultured Amnibacterium sp.]|uniref:alpha/beta fold hydrolase n=1 Tax=uncultured Amnibacterium sp. TaxID=1631851 RepID=UPI0035CC58D1